MKNKHWRRIPIRALPTKPDQALWLAITKYHWKESRMENQPKADLPVRKDLHPNLTHQAQALVETMTNNGDLSLIELATVFRLASTICDENNLHNLKEASMRHWSNRGD